MAVRLYVGLITILNNALLALLKDNNFVLENERYWILHILEENL